LHLGSLLTALLSYLDARAAGGAWLLRIDDLDAPRCDPAHSTRILRQLEAHGLHWDEAPRYQSAQRAEYEAALATLRAGGRVYGCDCTRRRLKKSATTGVWGPVYSGRCRDRGLAEQGDADLALRLRVPHGPARLEDDWQGTLEGDWQKDVGDFVLQRRDGIPGYALACAVDEHAMGITHIVRGADLLAPTLMHWAVLDALGHARPRSRHGPLLQRADGAKLSKQNHAAPIDESRAPASLLRCCAWLGVAPADADAGSAPAEILKAAVAAWRERPASALPSKILVEDAAWRCGHGGHATVRATL
jgi:glutamyl-Q tRNA(Asp) synthetase